MTCHCNPSQPCTCGPYSAPEPEGMLPVTVLALTIIWACTPWQNI